MPVSRIRAMIARATTSRGARSASSCWPCMNRTPSLVDEEGALAAHGLGDERLLAARALAEPEHRRVELHELEVGQLGPGAQRSGHAVAGRDGRVGRRRVDLAESARGQHDGARVGRPDAVDLALADDVQGHAADPRVRVGEQVDDEGVLDDLDAGVVAHPVERGDEGARDLLAGGVAAGVQDAVAVVATLAGQRDLAGVAAVEVGAERDEVPDARRALVDERLDGLDVTEADAGDEGVVDVLGGAVLRRHDGGDAALRPRRSTPRRARSWSRAAPGRPAAAAAGPSSARRCRSRRR